MLPTSSEFRMLTRDGRVVWFRDRSAVVRNDAGQPLFLQGIMIDITERKQAEEALREAKEHYRLITEHSGDLISWHSREGRTTYASPSLPAYPGLRSRRAARHLGVRLDPPDDVQGICDIWMKLAPKAPPRRPHATSMPMGRGAGLKHAARR